ncbi:MAG: SGNH/GDSL hydrolase family protein, partial [Nocardioides sp.]|nr:SGNH/GDSL hydrolase family protein [Nocardioides sp.]
LRIDLATHPAVLDRRFWSVDRLHPSESGHRALARGFAGLLVAEGLDFEPPASACDSGHTPTWRSDVAWLLTEGAPWVGRRARDLGPWAVRMAWAEAHGRLDRVDS